MDDDFAGVLQALMAERGLGVLALARKVPCDKAMISRLVNGGTRPSEQMAQRLDDVLGAGGQLAAARRSQPACRRAAPPAQPEPEDDDEMNRRELLRIFSLTGAVMAAGVDWERLATLGGQRPASAADAAELAAMNAHLWAVFAGSRSKRLAFPIVREQLGVVTVAMQRPQNGEIYQRLCAVAADLFQLAGEILFDATRYTDAAHCYTLAATAGREARSADLHACALTRHAFIGVYEGQPRSATPLLELAAGLAARGDHALSTRYWVAAVQAEAYAGLGEQHATERALETSAGVTGMSGRIHNGGWLRFDGSRLAEERGTCYAALGRPELAEAALLAALEGNLSARRRGGVHADLATTAVQRRGLGQAADYARPALDIARDTGSGVVGRKLTGLQRSLAPFMRDTRARQLRDQITAVAAGRREAG